MRQISFMDLYFLTKELQILENQRIDSFYLEDDIFYFKIYIKNQGNKFLTFNIGKYIYLGEKKDESSHPSSFMSYLRKYLKNTFIRTINLVENERILKIEIEKKIEENKFETYNLFLELFSPGNIILTDENLIIKNMLFRKKFKDRKVIAKEEYELPPKREFSIFNMDRKNFEIELKKSDLNIVKFLAINFGLGGKFAEELIFRCEIDKEKLASKIISKEIDTIIKKIEEIRLMNIEPRLILNSKDEIVDFTPFEFKSLEGKTIIENSFNDTLKKYYLGFKEEDKKDSKEKELVTQLQKLKDRLKKQEKIRDKILEESEKFNQIGNKIYENYSLIEELLNSINNSAKEKGWDYVIDKIKNSNDERLKIIKKVNYKNNEILIDLK